MTELALDQMVASMPFAVALGVELDAATADGVRGRMPWAPERSTLGGAMHGGALMAFADSLGAVAAFLNLPEGATTTTVSSSTTLTRGVTAGTVHGEATVQHAGRCFITVRTDVRDDEGRLVSQTTQTQAVL